jgi:hypothetical protein
MSWARASTTRIDPEPQANTGGGQARHRKRPEAGAMGDREMSEDDLFAVPPGSEFCYLATMRAPPPPTTTR